MGCPSAIQLTRRIAYPRVYYPGLVRTLVVYILERGWYRWAPAHRAAIRKGNYTLGEDHLLTKDVFSSV